MRRSGHGRHAHGVHRFVRHNVLVVLLALAACSGASHASTTGQPVAPVGAESAGASSPPPSAPSASPVQPSPPTTSTDDVVVARVVQSGPIGDGACVQCSHEVVVEQRISGGIAAGADPLWVHYEVCGGAPPPAGRPGAIDPCTLSRGPRYELTLRRGASANFGDAPMILDARTH